MDDITDKLVSGYLNEINKSIDREYLIPSLVSNSCLLFFFQRHIDKITNGDKITLSNAKRTASVINGEYCLCFGNILIHSAILNINGVLKLREYQICEQNLMIGICSNESLKYVTIEYGVGR